MREICARTSGGAQGLGLYTPGSCHNAELTASLTNHSSSMYNESDKDLTGKDRFYNSHVLLGSSTQDDELGFTQLLELGRGVTSPNPLTRLTVANKAVSTITQLNRIMLPMVAHSASSDTGSQSFFSDVSLAHPHPPSAHTMMSMTNRVPKISSQVRTPNKTPSIVLSHKCAKFTNAELTMTTMTGTLNRVTDCMVSMQSAFASSATPAKPTLGPPSQVETPPYQVLALSYLDSDTHLDNINPDIHANLFLEFMKNQTFCQMYSQTKDTKLHHHVALKWYQAEQHQALPNVASNVVGSAISSLSPISATSSSPFPPPMSTTDSPIVFDNSLTTGPSTLFNNQSTATGMAPTFNNGRYFMPPVIMEHTGRILDPNSSMDLYDTFNNYPYTDMASFQ